MTAYEGSRRLQPRLEGLRASTGRPYAAAKSAAADWDHSDLRDL
ncbi:MAG TPA: hypothetical protein VF116_10015 [Ktedonobacterales bacterium]